MPDAQPLPVFNVVVTNEKELGFTVTSPQLPGFVAIYEDEKQLHAMYKRDLQQAGVKRAQVIGHMQVRGVTPQGQEYAVRWSTDNHQEERTEAGRRAERMLHADEAEEFLADGDVVDSMGVVTFVCCLPSDTIGSVTSQLDERGDVLVIVTAIAEEMVFATAVGAGAVPGSWHSFEDLGITLDMTVNDLVMMDDRRPERIAFA